MAAKLTKAFARATGSGTDIMGGYRVATVDFHSSGGYENLRGANPVGGVETMAMPQRENMIETFRSKYSLH